MLTKRTNILFDEKLWERLSARALADEVSVGQLVRNAVIQVYDFDNKQERIAKAVEMIRRERRNHKKLDYKALITYGRIR